jgi:MarR family transcriptional regulator, transcriptional regulator for hemolysin
MNKFRDFGFILKEVSRLYTRRFEERARALGLTLPQCKVLVYLAKNEGVSQAKLSDLTEVEPMSLVRILDHMEDEGLLERRASPLDRRARSLFLRSKAKPIEDSIWSISDTTRGEAFAGISAQDAAKFISVFEQIRINVAALMLPAAASTVVPLAERQRRVRGALSVKRRPRRGAKS